MNIHDLLPCCELFRAWGSGNGNAGGYNAAGLPNIVGKLIAQPGTDGVYEPILSANIVSQQGSLTAGGTGLFPSGGAGSQNVGYGEIAIDAMLSSVIYGGSTTVMPASVDLPVMMYLGIPA